MSGDARSVGRQVELLEQFLRYLDESFDDGVDAATASLVAETRAVVAKLEERVVGRRITTHVAALAREGRVREAHLLLRRHFPGGVDDAVLEVLQLVYDGINALSFETAVEFVALLSPPALLLAAFKALAAAVQRHGAADKLDMLMLRVSANDLNVEALAAKDDLELHHLIHQVNCEYLRVVVGIVDQFMKNDVTLMTQIAARFGPQLLDRMLGDVVQNFCGGNLDNVLQLLAFSRHLPHTSNRCSLVGAVWLQFLHRQQGDTTTEQLMHLWAHATAVQQEQQFPQVSHSVQQLFEDAYVVLARDKPLFKSIYLKYLQSPELAARLQHLHRLNDDLIWLAAEVAMQRYGDKSKVLSMQMSRQVCPVDNNEVLGCMLHLLQPQKHSFEQFCVFVRARQLTKMSPVRSVRCLLDKMPSCVRLLLWPEMQTKGLQLVNEFYKKPLCIANSKVYIGAPAETKLPWGLSVEPASCLASFQLKTAFGCNGCKLSVLHGEVCIAAFRQQGCLWKIKAVDDAHIKIYSEKDEYLAAKDECVLEEADWRKRVVVVSKEEDSTLQLWRVEPF